jgi:hypothetical protein
MKISVRLPGVCALIRTEHIPNSVTAKRTCSVCYWTEKVFHCALNATVVIMTWLRAAEVRHSSPHRHDWTSYPATWNSDIAPAQSYSSTRPDVYMARCLTGNCNLRAPSLLPTSAGRAIAQTVSRRVRTQVRLCGICDGQSGTGAGFLRVLLFPLPILIPHSSSSIIRGWYTPKSGRSTKWIQSHLTPRN